MLVILPAIFVLVLVVVGGTFLFAALHKNVQQPGAQPVQGGGPAGGGPAWGGRWNAQLRGPATHGVLEIAAGHLAFVPNGAQVPQWRVPCTHLMIRKQGMISLDGADLEIHGPMGLVRCDVSREHINRFMTNDFKMFRERGYADQFLAAAAAHGARVAR